MPRYKLVVEPMNGAEEIIEAPDDRSAQRELMDFVANTVNYYTVEIIELHRREEAP